MRRIIEKSLLIFVLTIMPFYAMAEKVIGYSISPIEGTYGVGSQPFALNNLGEIVGYYSVYEAGASTNNVSVFLWGKDRGMKSMKIQLKELARSHYGYTDSSSPVYSNLQVTNMQINNSGAAAFTIQFNVNLIVNGSKVNKLHHMTLFWERDQEWVDVGALLAIENVRLLDINDSNKMLLSLNQEHSKEEQFIVFDLVEGSAIPINRIRPLKLNNHDEVLGGYDTTGSIGYQVLQYSGHAAVLRPNGELITFPISKINSKACAFNDEGLVVVEKLNAGGGVTSRYNTYLWNVRINTVELLKHQFTEVTAVNNYGVVIGRAEGDGYKEPAVLQDDKLHILNEALGIYENEDSNITFIYQLTDINDQGQVLVFAMQYPYLISAILDPIVAVNPN